MFNVRFPYESGSTAVKPQRQEGSLLGRIVSWVKNLVGFFTARKVDEVVKAIFTDQPEKSNLKKAGPDTLSSEPKKVAFAERVSTTTEYVVKSRKAFRKPPQPHITEAAGSRVPLAGDNLSVPLYLQRPALDFVNNYEQVRETYAFYQWYAKKGNEEEKKIAQSCLSFIEDKQQEYRKHLIRQQNIQLQYIRSREGYGLDATQNRGLLLLYKSELSKLNRYPLDTVVVRDLPF